MKLIKTTIKTLLFFSISLFSFTSCEDDLEIYSENAISPEQINSENIQFFLNGLYRSSTPIRDDYFYNDVRGGNYTWTALSGNNSKFGVLITGNGLDDRNAFSSSYWQFCYKNIYNANNLIAAAERLDEKQISAEAKYIRASMYFHLINLFGGVPLITINTTEDLPRSTREEIWQLIQDDLTYSIQYAKSRAEVGSNRISIEAAQAKLARTYLQMGKINEATDLALHVIENSGLTLDQDYQRIFRSTNTSSEIIFSHRNMPTESNIRLSQLFWPYGTAWAGSYFVQPSEEALHAVYEENDQRKAVNIEQINNSDGTFNMIISKYTDVQPLIDSRLSEMYFIVAEGKGMTVGLPYLNAIRTKNNLPEYNSSDFESEQDYLDLILLERRRELFSEGFLFRDLVRTDKAIQLPNISTRDHYYLPLPGSQIILSDGLLTQNPGY